MLCPGHKKCFQFWSDTFCLRNKCFPVCTMETMLPRFQCFLGFTTSSMRKIPCWSGKMGENTPPLLSTQPLQKDQNVTRRVKHERSWKNEEIETLIGLYEERVCQWDYINRDGKSLAYEQIDEEMKKYNISREEYKSKWKGLRGQFCIARAVMLRNCLPVCAAWKHNIHFVSHAFARPRNIMSNNVSATMCPRLPVPHSVERQ